MPHPSEITLKAPAKVNLYLEVIGKREDGYHDIASCMQRVGLYDHLTFRPRRSGIRLRVQNADLPADPSNLVYQAAVRLQREARRAGHTVGGAAIVLVKNIPMAAGLGGGSSDAATTLIGLNRLWRLGWRRARLARIGEGLGSDVPFFLFGPTAWVTGRGEQITRARPPTERWAVLVDPQQPVATRWVYAQFAERLGSAGNVRRQKKHRDARPPLLDATFTTAILRRPRNDLEAVTFSAFPHLRAIKKKLRAWGGRGALMSGSGATLFALFNRRDLAKRVAGLARAHGMGRVWVVRVLRS